MADVQPEGPQHPPLARRMGTLPTQPEPTLTPSSASTTSPEDCSSSTHTKDKKTNTKQLLRLRQPQCRTGSLPIKPSFLFHAPAPTPFAQPRAKAAPTTSPCPARACIPPPAPASRGQECGRATLPPRQPTNKSPTCPSRCSATTQRPSWRRKQGGEGRGGGSAHVGRSQRPGSPRRSPASRPPRRWRGRGPNQRRRRCPRGPG